MSDTRRIVEIYANTSNLRITDSAGKIPLEVDKLTFFVRSQTVIRCHLRLEDLSEFKPVAGAEWLFAIDDNYTRSHADYVVSQNDQFNIIADWADLDVDNGKICFRVDCATVQLQEAMGDDDVKAMVAELWMLPPAPDNPVLLGQWSIDVRNIVTEVGDDTDLEYISAGLLRADGDDTVLYFPDGSVAQRWSPS